MVVEKLQKVAEIFHCSLCDYSTSRKSSWTKHIDTIKHKKNENDSKSCKSASPGKYRCECGKEYRYDSGYYRHRKACPSAGNGTRTPVAQVAPEGSKQVFFSKDELVSLMREVVAENTSKLPSVHGDNNNVVMGDQNQIYSINVFLRDHCKDAMTIQHFMQEITLRLRDLQVDKRHAIASTLIQSLEPLALTQRPIHKTENEDEWYVNDEDKGWNEGDGDGVLERVDDAISKKWPTDFDAEHPDWIADPSLRDKYAAISSTASADLSYVERKELLDELGRVAHLSAKDIHAKSP